MSKKSVFKMFTALQVLLLVLVMIGAKAPTPVHAAAIKIMPLGDSITGSPGCWRALLWAHLQSTGYTNIDFVGTQPAQGCSVPYDGDSEGRGGLLATGAADPANLPVWLAANVPDIVIMHLGTNDVWSTTRSTSVILTAFTNMVGQMRAANPNVKILVAQILPMTPTGCATCPQGAIDLNAAIPAWAAGLTTAQSPIGVVDQWTGINTATDTADGVHPNDLGNQKIADKWYPALSALLTPTGNTATVTKTNTQGNSTVTATKTITPTNTNTLTRTLTPVISATVTKTLTRTNTPAITNTITRTPTVGITNTSTRTPTQTVGASPTAGPTFTRTVTPTITATSGAVCSPTATITAPFTQDGAGTFCWQSTNLGTFINSWNLTSLTVNGLSYTNAYLAAGSYPAKIGGFWYVSYNSTVAWGHFEAK